MHCPPILGANARRISGVSLGVNPQPAPPSVFILFLHRCVGSCSVLHLWTGSCFGYRKSSQSLLRGIERDCTEKMDKRLLISVR